jgi:hypothetical protein
MLIRLHIYAYPNIYYLPRLKLNHDEWHKLLQQKILLMIEAMNISFYYIVM